MTDILSDKAKELALIAYDEMKLSFESREPKKCEELEKELYKILRTSDLSITDQVHSVKQLLLNVLAMISAEHLKAELKMQTERAQTELR